MAQTNPKADWYFTKQVKWQEEITQLRTIVLSCGLNEDLKWGCPCYTSEDRNIVLIHVFKDYCALLFFKGALLSDPKGLLVQQTANVQAARQLRFTNPAEVKKKRPAIVAFVKAALAVEKKGMKVPLKKTREFTMPDEFRARLDAMPELEKAFKALTPGRQRAYLLYFSQAKQSATRAARVERYVKHIVAGKGIDD